MIQLWQVVAILLKILTNNLKIMIPVCDPKTVNQFVDMATHIERAFFKHEISDKEREKQYRNLYESVTDFRNRCIYKHRNQVYYNESQRTH